jgi:hypothetical protein
MSKSSAQVSDSVDDAATAPAPAESTSQQPTTAPSENEDPEKKKPDESDPWFGHLHHLSDEQEKALNEFRAVCAEKGLYRYAVSAEEGGDKEEAESGAAGPREASHDDATLLYGGLRFLRLSN